MYHLTGEFECKADSKGRIRLPSSLIRQLGEKSSLHFTINRGFERHLMMYPQDVWEKKTKELKRLNINIRKNRQAVRYLYRGATQITADSSERVLIPKNLILYAGIEKNVVLFAYLDQIEIWAKSAYQQMIDEEPMDFAELAEEVFGDKSKEEDE